MPEVQNTNPNVEKVMSEDGKSIVSVSYATDSCRYINNMPSKTVRRLK